MTLISFYDDGIEIKGHSLFDEKGKDLVCSAISSISYGFINSINENHGKYNIDEENTSITVVITNEINKYKNYLELLWFQFETIRKSYPQNINIIIKKGSINNE